MLLEEDKVVWSWSLSSLRLTGPVFGLVSDPNCCSCNQISQIKGPQ